MKKILKIVGVMLVAIVGIILIFRKEIQSYAVKVSVSDLCKAKVSKERELCEAKFKENFDHCINPLLAHEATTAEFLACLGIESTAQTAPVVQSEVLAECDQADFSSSIELYVGQQEADDQLRQVSWQDKTFYLSKSPSLTSADFRRFELTKEDGKAYIKIYLTDVGREKMAQVTNENINRYMAIFLNGKLETLPQIMTKISSGQVLLALTEVPAPGAICRSKS